MVHSRLLASIALVGIAFINPCSAGLRKNSVELSDLATLTAGELETLKESEFDVFRAQVALAGVQAASKRASGALKAAKRGVDVQKLDLKAAEAELKAAKANQDEERVGSATAILRHAREDLSTAELLVRWKEKETKVRDADVRSGKLGVDLAEANRDLARLDSITRAGGASSEGYDHADFRDAVAKRQKDYDKALKRAQADRQAMTALEKEWQERLRAHGSAAVGSK